MRTYFLALHQEKPSGVSGGKAPQIVPPPSPKAAPSGVSCFHVDPHSASKSSSKLLYKCSYQFMASVPSAPGKEVLAVTLCIHLSFQILGWRFSLCHSSLMGPRKAIDQAESLFIFFLVVNTGVTTFKFFSSIHIGAKTKSLEKKFF